MRFTVGYPDSPAGTFDACMVAVGEDRVLMLGGNINALATNRTFSLDLKADRWTELESMNERRAYPACGVVYEKSVARAVVVAGGSGDAYHDTADILDLKTMRWRIGR